jgi:hypothetical protein
LWNEWLWPFFPVSVLGALGFFSPRWAHVSWAVAAALAVYVGVAFFMLAGDVERGAYFLPFAFPAALLTASTVPRALAIGAGAVAAALAVAAVVQHDRPRGDDDAYAGGVLALAERSRPFVLCAGEDEVDPIMRRAADVPCVGLYALVGQVEREGYDYARLCAEFDGTFDAIAAQGRTFYVTSAAYSALALAGHPVLGPFFTRHLPQRYAFTPVQELGFAGYRMERKP